MARGYLWPERKPIDAAYVAPWHLTGSESPAGARMQLPLHRFQRHNCIAFGGEKAGGTWIASDGGYWRWGQWIPVSM